MDALLVKTAPMVLVDPLALVAPVVLVDPQGYIHNQLATS